MSAVPDDGVGPWETERALGRELDRMPTARLLAAVFEQDRAAVQACETRTAELTRLADRIAARLGDGGRLLLVGAGTSGRLAVLDAVELGPTFGVGEELVLARMAGGRDAMFRSREGAEDDHAAGAELLDELSIQSGDIVLGISASGRTAYVGGALRAAQERGIDTALLTCNAVVDAPADLVVDLATGPELLAGSTRMKAGTATKIALHALSLAVMTRLGHVYRDRMVDVRVGSRKLRGRAERMVAELAGVDASRAAELLTAADGSVKCAIVMGRLSVDPATARLRLDAADGHLRAALGEW